MRKKKKKTQKKQHMNNSKYFFIIHYIYITWLRVSPVCFASTTLSESLGYLQTHVEIKYCNKTEHHNINFLLMKMLKVYRFEVYKLMWQ